MVGRGARGVGAAVVGREYHAAALTIVLGHFEQVGQRFSGYGGNELHHVDARCDFAAFPTADGLACDEELGGELLLGKMMGATDSNELFCEGHNGSFLLVVGFKHTRRQVPFQATVGCATGAAAKNCVQRPTPPCRTMTGMEPIAHIHTDLPQKFGIPRNSFLAPHLQGRIVFEPEFASNAAVEGLDSFSHLWLLWRFENGTPGGTAKDIAADAKKQDRSGTNAKWSKTVRPPRLGGAERVGVFATRSPFRPNPIGLTCVKLDRVELTDDGPIIHVLGADLRDGTPIYDIKPYIPFADCHPDATGGWIEDAPWQELDVEFPQALQDMVPPTKLPGLVEVLRQDPRRAGSKHEPNRVYHLAFAGLDISFTVDETRLTVVAGNDAQD